ncbi:radical SAM protein [Candidatus Fermentibacteria bacterium]|nr:radical SAM protein [Candidatus Fermentibacteria bacterium]
MKSNYRYLFGPVPSRRFGLSLGIDLVPFKTCSYDCVFCQLGRTTHKTLTRAEYVPTVEVLDELTQWLQAGGTADYMTLSGSGEPTLHSGFGEVIRHVRATTSTPVAVLTNGSLLWDPAVREAAASAHVVKVSLSAWDEASWAQINRPDTVGSFDRMIEGQRRFRQEFGGELWVEVFIVWGMNSIPADVEKIAALVKSLQPEKVHLNTAVRPCAEEFVKPLSRDRMTALAGLFAPPAEVIGDFSASHSADVAANAETILAMLTRRPCTADQIGHVFEMHKNEVAKYLGELLRTRSIRAERRGLEVFYVATERIGTQEERV